MKFAKSAFYAETRFPLGEESIIVVRPDHDITPSRAIAINGATKLMDQCM